jgi:hypothetical protein
MFELLAPFFAVAGGALASIPILLHMFRRTPAVRMPFSLVRFLTPSLPKTTRRSTLEHWPLMLLRILAVTLIALAFSRPYQRLTVTRETASGRAARVAILIDGSASMRRDGLREAVLAEVRKVTQSLNAGDVVNVSSFSEGTRSLISTAEWQQADSAARAVLVERALEQYEPDWLSTQTGTALLEAADQVVRNENGNTQIDEMRVVLITDFQEGSDLEALRSGTWPDSVRLDLRAVRPQVTGNAGISLVADERSGRVRVRVTNSGDAANTKYSLQPFDANGAPAGSAVSADVGPGQRRTFSLPDQPPNVASFSGVEIVGDTHAFDNVVDLPPVQTKTIRIAHVGPTDANNADSMRYYLQRVLDGNESEDIEVVDLIGPDGVVVPPTADLKLTIITDVVPESLATALKTQQANGGTLFIVLKSEQMLNSVVPLLPGALSGVEATVQDYAMLGQLDFTSPLLSIFSDARFGDFSSIRFWQYRKLDLDERALPGVKVTARFDSGDPAILEIPSEAGGRVYVLAAGWHPADSQWALSTRFAPMLMRLVRLTNPRSGGHRIFEAGNRIQPAELANSDNWTLLKPDGTAWEPVPVAGPGALETQASEPRSTPEVSVLLDTPGRWILQSATAESQENLTLLVNVAASESRTEPLPAGQLQAVGLSADVAAVATSGTPAETSESSQLDSSELESRQKFWRAVLLAGLALLAIEAVMAAVIERRQIIPQA